MGRLVKAGGGTGAGAFSSSTNVQHCQLSIIAYMSDRTTQHSTAEQNTDVSNVLA